MVAWDDARAAGPQELAPPAQRPLDRDTPDRGTRRALDVQVRATLSAHAPALGLRAGDVEAVVVRHVLSREGFLVVHLSQRLHGLRVVGADWALALLPDGRLVGARDRLIRLPALPPPSPQVPAAAAVRAAAEALGLGASIAPLRPPTLRWLRLGRPRARDAALRLTWHFVLRPSDRLHTWDVDVDARSGALRAARDLVRRDAYRAYPFPLESPLDGARTFEQDPALESASPHGWHDRDGAPGAETTDTSGANVEAQEDVGGDDGPGDRPDGGPDRVFDFPLDPNLDPTVHEAGTVSHAFYLTNRLHDLWHHFGFDEAAGNFQQSNPGGLGLGGDPLLVDVFDPAVPNNASFETFPDGTPSRMQMGIFSVSLLEILEPAGAAGFYPAGRAAFGAALTPEGTRGDLIAALDAADPNGPTTTDGCSPFGNAAEVEGEIALIDRGTCLFVDKVRNAQAAGAIGVVVANNAGEALVVMAGDDPNLVIPALFVGQSDGAALRNTLGVNGVLAGYARDSALDATLIVHEYAHGVSTRLAGGPGDASCLSSARAAGMGEGWSDWFALVLTARFGQRPEAGREVGAYSVGESPGGPGLRDFPYTTDGALNPLTYEYVETRFGPHDKGEIWAVALWQLYWNLVTAYGFDPDFETGAGGNQRAFELVTHGLSLQTCEPSFLDGRDALLAADQALRAGRDRCRIWDAFTRRGMGPAAVDGEDVAESFVLPAECAICGDVNDDEGRDLLDLVRMRRALLGLAPRLVAPEKCNTRGPTAPLDENADGVPDDCGGDDVLAVREALAGLTPGVAAVCESASPLAP